MYIKLNSLDLDILKVLSFIIDVEEGAKLWHSWRVGILSKWIAEDVCKDSVLALYIAGLLHDIGTFDMTNRMIHHQQHMEDISSAEVRVHPQKGAAVVASIEGFISIAKMILDHHEWISGQGYPRGLGKDQISPESQILRIADKAAFIFDTNKDITFDELKSALEKKVDREYSKELYDCLIKILSDNEKFECIKNENKLSEATKDLFSGMKESAEHRYMPFDKNLLLFFGRILDAKHSYTEGHSRRVAYFTTLIALGIGLSDEQIERIEAAAFLHDIGKIGIPNSILDKKGPLTDEEHEIIKTHASLSYDIVKDISMLANIADIVGADQEHWDGSGYPKGLKKQEIPLGARIIFIADAFDAMTSNRSYHRAIPVSEAIKELKRCAGTDFDPDIVEAAVKLFEGFENSAVIACYPESE